MLHGDDSVTKKLGPWINLGRELLNCFIVCTSGVFQYVMGTPFPIANKECKYSPCRTETLERERKFCNIYIA